MKSSFHPKFQTKFDEKFDGVTFSHFHVISFPSLGPGAERSVARRPQPAVPRFVERNLSREASVIPGASSPDVKKNRLYNLKTNIKPKVCDGLYCKCLSLSFRRYFQVPAVRFWGVMQGTNPHAHAIRKGASLSP